jgi:tetratricopeptide (TPR) repeat protein
MEGDVMTIRGYSGIVLLLIAGCGGPNAPGEVDEQTKVSDSALDSAASSSIDADPEVEFEKVLVRLQHATVNRRFELAAKIADEALELQPDNTELLVKATNVSQWAAMVLAEKPDSDRKVANAFFFKAASFVRRLRTLQDERGGGVPASLLSTALYNEACAYATNGNIEMALASLKETFESGPVNLTQLESDPDLDSLRDLPGFISMAAEAGKGED